MADSKELQQIVEHAVAQVLDRQLPKLQAELVARLAADLPAVSPARGKGAGGAAHIALVPAVASIQAGTTQKEILRALLFQPSLAFKPEPRKKKSCVRCSMPAACMDRASPSSW